MNGKKKKIQLIIPVFRNKDTLLLLTREITILFANHSECEAEFLFINDGSDDTTLVELETLKSEGFNVAWIELSKNYGQVIAIVAGIDYADGDVVIIMSADRQEPANLILEMVESWQEGNEIVIAHRTNRNDGRINKFFSNFFFYIIRFFQKNMPAGGFDFVLLDKKAYEVLRTIQKRKRFLQGDILNLPLQINFIPYTRLKRVSGKSQWKNIDKLKYLLTGIISTSSQPRKTTPIIGCFILLIGIVGFIIKPASKALFVISFVLALSGILILLINVIWNSYNKSYSKPYYTIKKKSISKN